MKKFKASVFIVFLFFSYFSIKAQELPNIIPPSPEATSIAKHTEIPVSYYTGLPNINVPLYQINLDGLSIPISLTYHAKGIKVSEVAPRVGIGWSLVASGSITRQIRGLTDDSTGGDTVGYLTENYYETFFDDTPEGDSTRLYVWGKHMNNLIDLYPDQFMFNFLGYSGKFIFDQRTKLPIIQEFQDLKIIPSFDNYDVKITSWKVITPEGYVGVFNVTDKEITGDSYVDNYDGLSSVPSSPDNSTTTWYLSSITSPKGNSVYFAYDPEYPSYVRRSYDKIGDSGPSAYFSRVQPKQNQIEEITFNGGKIKFVKSTTSRSDLANAYALDKIEVLNSNDDLIKSYKFNYSYSINTDYSNVLQSIKYEDTLANKRLFLDSIEEIATDEVNNTVITKPYYSFNYINKNDTPNRFSNAQDFWGYYNGKNNGSYLTFYNYGSQTIDRRVDTIKVQTGLLNKMTLPTGGNVAFEYESNRAVPPSYFDELLFTNPNPITPANVLGISKYSLYWIGNKYANDIIIPENKVGAVKFYITLSSYDDGISTTCDYRIYLKNNDTNEILPIYIDDNCEDVVYINFFDINSGNYTLIAESTNSQSLAYLESLSNDDDFFSVNVSWYEQVVHNDDLLYTSGNRIKKVIFNEANDDNVITKEYEYKDTEGNPSGKIFSLPMYYHIEKFIGDSIPVITHHSDFGARPGSPLTYKQGNHEGYSHVNEYQTSSTDSLKTSFEFTTIKDGGKFYTFPYTLATDNEWLRGKLLRTTYFKKENNVYAPVKEIVNEYLYGGITNDSFYFLMPLMNPNDDTYQNTRTLHSLPLMIFKPDASITYNPNLYKQCLLTSGTQDLYKTIEKEYFDNGILEKETTTEYNYDNHYKPAKVTTVTSEEASVIEDEPVIQTFTYPQDFVNSYTINPLIYSSDPTTALAEQNRVVPLEVKTFVDTDKDSEGDNTEQTSMTKTIYAWDDPNTKTILEPSIVQTGKGSSPILEDRIEFHDYDDYGNPLEVSKADGTRIMYIWGYNNTVPIAKIEGYSYDDVTTNLQSLINSAILASNNDIDDATEETLRSSLNSLRNHIDLSQAMVSTYTYDPLVGVTSMTDPRGNTTYYKYDDFNRLEYVKDQDGNLLSKNEYNYRTQN